MYTLAWLAWMHKIEMILSEFPTRAGPHLSHHCHSSGHTLFSHMQQSHLVDLPTSVTPLQLHTPSVILKMYVCFLELFRALSVTPTVPQLFTHNQNEFLFPKAVQGTLSHPTAPQLSAPKNLDQAASSFFDVSLKVRGLPWKYFKK